MAVKLIDPEIGDKMKIADYNVRYYIYTEHSNKVYPKRVDDPEQHEAFSNVRRFTGVCFSGLLAALRNNKNDINRVSYSADLSNAPLLLSLKDREYWIKLCKKHNILPPYTPLASAKDMVLVVKIHEKLAPSHLYCYLCAFRNMVEMPYFVKAMLYLVKTVKMNFYTAWVFASQLCVPAGNGIHHVGEWTKSYLPPKQKNDINLMGIKLSNILNLYLYLKDPNKYDTRGIFSSENWSCGKTINNIYKGDNKTITAPVSATMVPEFNTLFKTETIDATVIKKATEKAEKELKILKAADKA